MYVMLHNPYIYLLSSMTLIAPSAEKKNWLFDFLKFSGKVYICMYMYINASEVTVLMALLGFLDSFSAFLKHQESTIPYSVKRVRQLWTVTFFFFLGSPRSGSRRKKSLF